MRSRFLAALTALLAVLAVGCGTSDGPAELSTGLPDPADDGDPGAVVAPDGGVDRLLSNAAERSAELGSVRFSLEMTMGGLPDMGGDDVTVTVTGAVSEDGTRGEMRFDMSEMMDQLAADPVLGGEELAALFGEPIEVRYDGTRVYMTSSFVSWLVPVDTPWVTFVDEGGGSGAGFETDQIDPQELLVVLRGLGDDAEIVGTEELDGVTTTHVRGRFSAANVVDATADLDGIEEMLAGLDPSGMGAFALAVFDVDVWIGDDGIVRRLRLGIDDVGALDPSADADAFMIVTMELTDIGETVEITIPPADQVTDLDELGFDGLFG